MNGRSQPSVTDKDSTHQLNSKEGKAELQNSKIYFTFIPLQENPLLPFISTITASFSFKSEKLDMQALYLSPLVKVTEKFLLVIINKAYKFPLF